MAKALDMQSRHHVSSVRRLLGFIFLCSLAGSLWLGSVSLTTWQGAFWKVVTAPTSVNSDGGRTLASWKTSPFAAMSVPSEVRSDDDSQGVQEGIKWYKIGDYIHAIESWQQALTFYKNNNNSANAAIVIKNLALAYQQMGESEKAIAYLEGAIAFYHQVQDLPEQGRILTEQAQAYSSLGQSEKVIALENSALQIARNYKDLTLEATVLLSRGETYRLEGDYKQAIADLKDSAKIADKINNLVNHASALNNLGNAYVSLARINYRRANSALELGNEDEAHTLKKKGLNYDFQALKYFFQSLSIAHKCNDQVGEICSLINSVPPANRTNQSKLAASQLQQALALLNHLTDSPVKVYAAIELASFVQSHPVDTISPLIQCSQKEAQGKSSGLIQKCLIGGMRSDGELTLKLLNQAISIAQRLQDFRALAFALGDLGHSYECRQEYQQAIKLTQQAQSVAEQNLNAKDSLYLWEWQAGRIMRVQNKPVEAIAAYERAVTALQNVRSDIVVANPDLQFDLRDTIEPIYRELIALKLSLEDNSYASSKNNRNENLSYVLNTVDTLKLAELQNYLGKNSISKAVHQKKVALVGATTAVFSSILLEDRTAIIVSLPSGDKRFKWINLDNNSLKQEISKFRIGLEKRSDIIYHPQQAQKLYDWIVRPFANDLESSQIKTLVFIQDGILRSVPMAALLPTTGHRLSSWETGFRVSLSLLTNLQQLRVVHSRLRIKLHVGRRTICLLQRIELLFGSVRACQKVQFSKSVAFVQPQFLL